MIKNAKWRNDMGYAFRKKQKNNFVQYTVRIRENILNEIREISKKEEISVNEIVNQSLELLIEEYNKK